LKPARSGAHTTRSAQALFCLEFLRLLLLYDLVCLEAAKKFWSDGVLDLAFPPMGGELQPVTLYPQLMAERPCPTIPKRQV
jgi:hypothetical protein